MCVCVFVRVYVYMHVHVHVYRYMYLYIWSKCSYTDLGRRECSSYAAADHLNTEKRYGIKRRETRLDACCHGDDL